MNSKTYDRVPDDAKTILANAQATIVIDETVPDGKVRVDSEGTELPFGDWLQTVRLAGRQGVAERRAVHKQQRQNRQRGRRQAR